MPFAGLTDADRALVRRCLRAAADGPFVADREFHRLFGLERMQVRAKADNWPPPDQDDAALELAVGNSLNILLGYPHGRGELVAEMTGASEDELRRLLDTWNGPELEPAEEVELDLSKVESAHAFHVMVAKALRFPDFYGHNWDAFWDAISGLVPMPRRLTLRHWEQFERALPHDARILRRCLDRLRLESVQDCAVMYD